VRAGARAHGRAGAPAHGRARRRADGRTGSLLTSADDRAGAPTQRAEPCPRAGAPERLHAGAADQRFPLRSERLAAAN